ncbi:MAG: phosphomannomutase, partial [Frankiaceae bacterium]|nr:phosphomannomutase [Frankiaceae bacterium]
MDADLRTAALAWAADDPDAADRAEVQRLLDAADGAALAIRFGQPLRFGTAGIRGAMQAGPAGINTATVSRTARGLGDFLGAGTRVVVGHDARH